MKQKTQLRKAQPPGRPKDKRLSRMVLLSALIHVVLVVYMVTSVRQGQSEIRVLQTYTVALVSAESLGFPTPAQPAVSEQEVKPEVAVPQMVAPRHQPPPAKKEVTSQKPTAIQKEVTPVKSAKAAPNKKKTVKIAAKKKTTPKKKAQQKVKAKKPKKEAQTQPTSAQEQTSRQKETQTSTQKRDQQILAALEKVRQRVKGAGDQARPAKNTKNSKRGASSGAARQGDGGGVGPVRGLQFILYTEQVKRQVKQSWIVAELKTGLTVIVRFGIQANGQVFDVEFAQRSGDMAFDESAVRAVRKASPLPPPPAAYRYEFARQKVEVVFGETSRIQ